MAARQVNEPYVEDFDQQSADEALQPAVAEEREVAREHIVTSDFDGGEDDPRSPDHENEEFGGEPQEWDAHKGKGRKRRENEKRCQGKQQRKCLKRKGKGRKRDK